VSGQDRGAFAPRSALALLCALLVLDFADRQVVVTAFPYLRAEFALSEAQLGALVSAVSVVIALGALPAALVVDRSSRVRAIAVMGSLWSVATAACALAPGYLALLAARTGIGVGQAGFGPAGSALLAATYPSQRRATVLGVFQMGAPLGLVTGSVVGSLVAALVARHGMCSREGSVSVVTSGDDQPVADGVDGAEMRDRTLARFRPAGYVARTRRHVVGLGADPFTIAQDSRDGELPIGECVEEAVHHLPDRRPSHDLHSVGVETVGRVLGETRDLRVEVVAVGRGVHRLHHLARRTRPHRSHHTLLATLHSRFTHRQGHVRPPSGATAPG
jgi:hypothetical protein